MAKVNFVGFQESVEVPEGFKLLEIKDEISSKLGKDELFSYLSRADLISQWFYQVSNLDLRPGGKISFIDDSGKSSEAVCTSVIFGKEISLLADVFGNFTAKVKKAGSGSKVEAQFKILTDNPEAKSQRVMEALEKLRALVS
jgi:hypothetical protein